MRKHLTNFHLIIFKMTAELVQKTLQQIARHPAGFAILDLDH